MQQIRKADPQTPARQRSAESQTLHYSISMYQLKFHNFPSLTKCVHTHVTHTASRLVHISSAHALLPVCSNGYSGLILNLAYSGRVLGIGSEHRGLPIIPSSLPSLQESPDGVCAPREPRTPRRERMGGHSRVCPQLTECLPGIHGTLGSIPSTRSRAWWNRVCNISTHELEVGGFLATQQVRGQPRRGL